MNIAEKIANLISERRQGEEEQARIKAEFPAKKKLMESQLKSLFNSFYNQVVEYVNEGKYLSKDINEEKNLSIFLFEDKLITLSFVDSEEESSYFNAIVKVEQPKFGDMKYDLNVRYSDGSFNWYHREKKITSDTFEGFMDEILNSFPF